MRREKRNIKLRYRCPADFRFSFVLFAGKRPLKPAGNPAPRSRRASLRECCGARSGRALRRFAAPANIGRKIAVAMAADNNPKVYKLNGGALAPACCADVALLDACLGDS